ncbi:MAG: hypothetical protein K6G50_04970 [bacterium]|nr:hypothetical protein [bacterium]
MNPIEQEYDRLLAPILSNESIWSNGNMLTIATLELCEQVFSEGYNKEDFKKIMIELYKRREPMMEERFKRTGLGYTL